MSGLYGLGRAFNLKYRPNGPLKTFIYDRRMPIMGFGGRPHVSHGTFMQENIVIDYGKRGFWGNLADIITGLAGGLAIVGNLFGSNKSDIIQGPEEQQVKPQGAKSTDNTDAENLKRLEVFAKPKGIQIVSEGKGKFTLLAKDGKNIKDAEYKEAQDWIMNYNTTPKDEVEPKKATKEEQNQELKDETVATPKSESGGAAQRSSKAKRPAKVDGKDNTDKVKNEPPQKENTKLTVSLNLKSAGFGGVNGSASIKLPNGQTKTVYTGWSRSAGHAIDDLKKQLEGYLKNSEFSNCTLSWPSSYKVDDSPNNVIHKDHPTP